ncbi:MAG TPA: alpha/beta family hydrolase [Stellaceae bacterium]|nr:alpha/beta family hydrolase [Stellaceae bacterium]
MRAMPSRVQIEIPSAGPVTAIVYEATPGKRAGIALLLGHGAGGNQMSPFMVDYAKRLAERGIEVASFNFLYSEQKRKLPDRTDKLEACWRAVIHAARSGALGPEIARAKLAIGGKSMGGRIASQVAAADSEGIAGLVLLGYPLHPPGRPEQLRTKHLPAIAVPMLIVQGERDTFGTPDELRPVLRALKAKSELFVVEAGDHSFKVPKSAGTPQAQVHGRILDEIARWLRATAGA